MYTHTQMNRKEPMIKPEACRIVDIKELPASRFEEFRKNLLNDYDFISESASFFVVTVLQLCLRIIASAQKAHLL